MSANETSVLSDAPSPSEAAPASPSAGQERAEISWETALAEAEAELGVTGEGDGEAGSPEQGQTQDPPAAEADATTASAPAEGEQPGQSPDASRTPADTTQADLNRIMTLVRDGRIGELTARQRGIYDAIQARVRDDIDLEQKIVDRLIELKTLRHDDPDGFLDWRESNPTQARAYDEALQDPRYASVTADNRRPTESPEQIRAHVQGVWERAAQETAQVIALDGGLSNDEYAKLSSEHEGNFGALLQASFNAALEKSVAAKLRDGRAALEKEITAAVRKELEVEYADTRAMRFAGGGATGNPGGTAVKAHTLEEALAASYDELARGGIPTR